MVPHASKNGDCIQNSENIVDSGGILFRVPADSLHAHPFPPIIIICSKDTEDSAHDLAGITYREITSPGPGVTGRVGRCASSLMHVCAICLDEVRRLTQGLVLYS